MVNSAEGSSTPDFDRGRVWKIIVGGAKLSRGYTVEGLTISYFRRPVKMHDSLMQMGRWFGYRNGYSDLIRLFIGRSEGKGQDLYKCFEAACKDEEKFREQLSIYEGEDGVTPLDIPALVFNSHPELKPTAKNKMFHADLTWLAFDLREPLTQSRSPTGRKQNAERFAKIFSRVKFAGATVQGENPKLKKLDFLYAYAENGEIVDLLDGLKWQKTSPIAAEVAFLKREDGKVKRWLILAPQVQGGDAGEVWKAAGQSFRCVGRSIIDDRFKAFSDSKHRAFAQWILGDKGVTFISDRLQQQDDVGVLLFYPTREIADGKLTGPRSVPVMGFSLLLPKRLIDGQKAYRVKSSSPSRSSKPGITRRSVNGAVKKSRQ